MYVCLSKQLPDSQLASLEGTRFRGNLLFLGQQNDSTFVTQQGSRIQENARPLSTGHIYAKKLTSPCA